MHPQICVCWLLAAQLAVPFSANGQTPRDSEFANGAEPAAGFRPSKILLETLEPPELRLLAAEILDRNPDVARARAWARAAAARAPQVRSFADPVAALTVFLLPPETRVGPQRFMVSVTQELPWFGKLALREQAALYAATAAMAEVESLRLALITETRRQLAELWFLDRHEAVAREERGHLLHHEEASRAGYAAGQGMQQAVIKIHAEITRAEQRVLGIATRRHTVLAAVNGLRDLPATTPVDVPELLPPRMSMIDGEALRRRARERRPELRRAAAELATRRVLVDLAEKEFRPDFRLGLDYILVDRRHDAQGRANPPLDDGDDILALSADVVLPVRRGRRTAALEEALAHRRAAEEAQRAAQAEIERELGDHAARLPLLLEQWQLFENVLLLQAEEVLNSAEAAYTTGNRGAHDLLDAEHVLFEVRIATARTHADVAIVTAELEAAAVSPLSELGSQP